jgi:hypothetical protein
MSEPNTPSYILFSGQTPLPAPFNYPFRALDMSTVLDDIIRDRISFLQELIRPENKLDVNMTFQLQIEILQSADLEKLDRSVLIRRAHLKRDAMDIGYTDYSSYNFYLAARTLSG